MLNSTGTLKHDLPKHINDVQTWEQWGIVQQSSAGPDGHCSPRQDCAVLAGAGQTMGKIVSIS